jgi:hypothetical protein
MLSWIQAIEYRFVVRISIMSETSESSTNGTIIVSGPDVLQISDFYVKAGVLHSVAVGSIAVIVSSLVCMMGFLLQLISIVSCSSTPASHSLVNYAQIAH